MTRSRIDQAPINPNGDDESSGDNHDGNPRSQDFFRSTPADVYERQQSAPIDRDPTPNTRRALIVAGAALGFTGVAASALYFGVFRPQIREIEQLTSSQPGTSASAFPSQESLPGDTDGNGAISIEEMQRMSGEEFSRLGRNSRIEFKGKELANDKPEAFRIYSQYLTDDERQVMYMPTGPLKSGQDYLNNYSLGIYLSSIQPPTPEGAENGKKLFSIVADPESAGYSDINDMIGNAPGISSVYRQVATPFNGDLSGVGEFMGHELNGLGGYLAYGEYVSNGEGKGDKQYMLFVNYPGPDGEPVSMLEDIYSGNERAFMDEISGLSRIPA